MDNYTLSTEWQENVLLIDMDYIDNLVWQWSIQLERMLERRIPKVDLAKWADFLVLDGGLRPGNNKTQLLLLYSPGHEKLKNLLPVSLTDNLNGKAFNDNLGEFFCASAPYEQAVTTMGEFYADMTLALASASKVKRLMLVADMDSYGNLIQKSLNGKRDQQQEITLFVQSSIAKNFNAQQEIITYSLLAAMNVKAEELKP